MSSHARHVVQRSQSSEFLTLIADGDPVALEWSVHARTAARTQFP